ncbi:MAG: glutamate racemase [Verrucomicrobiae bacterium]|nr:glutamate racemase [Verrucomicrobiae bacterium]NNJ43057.1 glutamate racemase [Akkermansiaceae bacterium]
MTSPIGILDSGLGGLSVLNEIHKVLPNENIVYFGDSAWCPYGSRHGDEIQDRVFKVTDFLMEHGCKMIVVACNSATIAAVEALRATYPLPFVGMEPAVKPATMITQSGTVGVLATEASLAGEKFHRLVSDHASEIKVITRPCPRFVDLVEAGDLTSDRARTIVEEETLPLIEAGADVLVLGCTHYPFLRPLIEQVAGPDIGIIDTGEAVAQRVASQLPTHSGCASPQYKIFTSGNLSHLKNNIPLLCPHITPELAHLDLA